MSTNESTLIESEKKESREKLAKQVSLFAIAGVSVIGITGILVLPWINKDQREGLTYVYSVILPLIGTWMGTILAYYFSKDNFEAANKSV